MDKFPDAGVRCGSGDRARERPVQRQGAGGYPGVLMVHPVGYRWVVHQGGQGVP